MFRRASSFETPCPFILRAMPDRSRAALLKRFPASTKRVVKEGGCDVVAR